jgi:molecular chaperone HscC
VGLVVGIDLGTTNSAIGVLEGTSVRLFPNPLGDVLTPSAVALDPKSRSIIVGRTAKDMMAATPGVGAARFKTDIGSDRRHRVGDRSMTTIELSAYVLDSLRCDAERALNTTVNRCVVTVPAYFDDSQRHATRQAAEQAGFAVERIINEPTAAAIAYGLHRRDNETMFAIVDLGGGTFDVCVMELFEGVLQVKGVAGESRLGGEDFSAELARYMATRANLRCPEQGTLAWALLYKRAELAKRALARWPKTEVTLSREITGGQETSFDLAVEDADRVWEPLIQRLYGPLRAALRGAHVERSQLADVVLVGGATRMPCVRRAVAEVLEREPLHHGDPDLLVAEGAAIQGGMIDRATAVDDIVVTDVASHSLGVSMTRQIGNRRVDGYFSPIIHRNTVIPTSRWDSYSTLDDDQRSVKLEVYEGDGRRVEDNRRIGQLDITGIPRGPAPKTFRVRFTYDLNGMLEVEAVIEETNKSVSAVFERTGGKRLAGAELETARNRLRAIRADPMDRPRYRDLMSRAKLLWHDGDAALRARIDPLLERFEEAMEVHNPAELERTYQALLDVCQAIDRGERW